MLEENKSFTEIIRCNFRKNISYIALAALSLGGGCGTTPTEIYAPQYTSEYTRSVPTEFIAGGNRVYREEKVRINDPRARLIEILRGDCERVDDSSDLITCEDNVCVDYTPLICSKGKYGDGSCRGGECNAYGYRDRWELPLKGISSVFAEIKSDRCFITLRKGQKGWSQEEKYFLVKNTDICKEAADILYTSFREGN